MLRRNVGVFRVISDKEVDIVLDTVSAIEEPSANVYPIRDVPSESAWVPQDDVECTVEHEAEFNKAPSGGEVLDTAFSIDELLALSFLASSREAVRASRWQATGS